MPTPTTPTPTTPTHRVGVVVPSVNTVIEAWYPKVLPPGIGLNVARMLIGQTVTPEVLREMDGYGVEAARTLSTCRPDVIVYGCTASSLVGGRDYDLRLMQELNEATGLPCLTTTENVLRALRHLGVHTVAAASPYTEQVGAAEVGFLVSNGYPVTGHAHLGITGGFDLASPSAADIRKVALSAWEDADGAASALFIGCMNLNSHLVIAELEAELEVPVLTATQATIWAVLEELGSNAEISGYGRLLEQRTSVGG